MEQPKPKLCAHFNSRALKDFLPKMNRETFNCDICCNPPPKLNPNSPTPEGMQLTNLLVCLSCFHLGCKRQTENQCMLHHGDKTKHQVTYDLSFGSIWCYGCDSELKEMLLEWEVRESKGKLGRNEKKKLSELKNYVRNVDKNVMELMKIIKKKEIEKKEREEIEGRIEEEEDDKDLIGIILEVYIYIFKIYLMYLKIKLFSS